MSELTARSLDFSFIMRLLEIFDKKTYEQLLKIEGLIKPDSRPPSRHSTPLRQNTQATLIPGTANISALGQEATGQMPTAAPLDPYIVTTQTVMDEQKPPNSDFTFTKAGETVRFKDRASWGSYSDGYLWDNQRTHGNLPLERYDVFSDVTHYTRDEVNRFVDRPEHENVPRRETSQAQAAYGVPRGYQITFEEALARADMMRSALNSEIVDPRLPVTPDQWDWVWWLLRTYSGFRPAENDQVQIDLAYAIREINELAIQIDPRGPPETSIEPEPGTTHQPHSTLGTSPTKTALTAGTSVQSILREGNNESSAPQGTKKIDKPSPPPPGKSSLARVWNKGYQWHPLNPHQARHPY